jgi:hypothetical protein
MSLPVVYRRQVGRDLAAGFGYYERQTKGLGERFLSAVGSAFDAIERYPQMFEQVHGEVRRALLSHFPHDVGSSHEVLIANINVSGRLARVWVRQSERARRR